MPSIPPPLPTRPVTRTPRHLDTLTPIDRRFRGILPVTPVTASFNGTLVVLPLLRLAIRLAIVRTMVWRCRMPRRWPGNARRPRTEGPSCQVTARARRLRCWSQGPAPLIWRRETGTGGRASCSLGRAVLSCQWSRTGSLVYAIAPLAIGVGRPLLGGAECFAAGTGDGSGEDGSR